MIIVEEMFFNEFELIVDFYGEVDEYIKLISVDDDSLPELNLKKAPKIELKNLSFSYNDKDVLKNINLNIEANTKVCIVGENGAGKTTLSKLLLGIYKAKSGDVLIDGNSSSEYTIKQGRSAVFQELLSYALSNEENISISDENENSKWLKEISDFFDIEFNDEILSKEFGNVELSKGNIQLLQILRGFYRESSLVVLDEPTASIDPERELKLIKWILDNLENKTSIIVTHRMSLTKFVDRIIVLENGEVIEDGTFEDLISKDSKFAKLHKNQSKWYSD